MAHFEDLEQCYFSNKMSRITGTNTEENSTRNICISSDPVLIIGETRLQLQYMKEGHE